MAESTHFLNWLPDEKGLVVLEAHAGPVRAEHPETFLKDIMGAMEAGEESAGIRAIRHELAGGDEKRLRAWRGLMAFALLSDMLVEESVRIHAVRAESGALCRSVLEVMGEEEIMLLSVKEGNKDLPLGMTDSRFLLIPSRAMERDHTVAFGMLPWYTDAGFDDPLPHLDPMMRNALLTRLRAAGGGREVQVFLKDLEAAQEKAVKEASAKGRWDSHFKSVTGLMGEKGFEELAVRVIPGKVTDGCPLLQALHVEDPVKTVPDQRVYSFRDREIARESPVCLLEFGRGEKAAEALFELSLDQQILETCVRPYAAALAERMRRRSAGTCDERVRSHVLEMAGALEELSARQTGNISLTYPWRAESPALMNLLEETLGSSLVPAALSPFSDRLTLMTGASFADPMMERSCTFSWEGGQYLVLPPISADLARWEAERGDSLQGYMPDSLRFSMEPSGQVTVTFSIQGENGSISVKRTYTDMEQVILRENQIPDLTLWPSVPVPGSWKAYYLSLRGRICLKVWDSRDEKFQTLTSDTDEDGNFLPPVLLRVSSFPSVMVVSRNDLTLGALFYAPEPARPMEGGDAVCALDIGESGTAMAVRSDSGMERVSLPPMAGKIWHGTGNADPAAEVLPMEGKGPLVESAVQLMPGEGTEPFRDGAICPVSRILSVHPCCHFLWRTDPDGIRAQRILLRQLMLEVCLNQAMQGRSSVTWRLSVPHSASQEDWGRLEKEAQSAARDVQNLCGMPCRGIASAWHDTRAAGQYLYQAMNRTSFLMLDLGGGDAAIALWLRGMPGPVLEMDAGDGFALAWHTAFLDIPLTAAQDMRRFTYLDNGNFTESLLRSRDSVLDWEKSRHFVDLLLGPYLQETIGALSQALMSGTGDYSQALLLLEMCRKMVLCGLAVEEAGNTSTLVDRLPETLPVVLCGRGSQIYMVLPENLKNALMRFAYLPMRESLPVKRMMLQMSPENKMEAAFGLLLQEKREDTRARITACRNTVPLDWLLGNFIMLFGSLFPQMASLLFPGALRPDGVLSDVYANQIIGLSAIWQGDDMEEALRGCLQRLRAWPATAPVSMQTAAPT